MQNGTAGHELHGGLHESSVDNVGRSDRQAQRKARYSILASTRPRSKGGLSRNQDAGINSNPAALLLVASDSQKMEAKPSAHSLGNIRPIATAFPPDGPFDLPLRRAYEIESGV